MQRDALLGQRVAEAMAVVDEIFIIQKHRGAVDPAMRDMQGQPGEFEARTTGHRIRGVRD